jgi:S1-C subfamily serine protease
MAGGIRIESPLADGTLGPRGFRVLVPNLAERGSIELGDVILGVNGRPVNSLADLYRLYKHLQSDSTVSVIQVDLERQGRVVTKIYHLR